VDTMKNNAKKKNAKKKNAKRKRKPIRKQCH